MEDNKLNAKHAVKSTFCAYFFSMLIPLMGMVVIMLFYSLFTGKSLPVDFFTDNAWGYLIAGLFLNLTLVSVFILFNKGKQNKITDKTHPGKVVMYMGIIVVAFFMLVPITICLDNLFLKMHLPISDLPYPLNTKNYLITIVSIGIIPPICEELLFRGFVFKSLKGYGKAFSVLTSSLMFALFHMSINQLVYPFLMGCIFAVIMYKENNIIYTILMHITNNVLSLTFSYFNIPLSYNHWSFILLSIALAIVATIIIIYFAFKNNKNTKFKDIAPDRAILIIGIAIMVLLMIILLIGSKL